MAQSQFFGTVNKPGGTTASRTGTKSDGLELSAYDKDFIIETQMWWNKERDENMVQLRMRNRETGRSHLIFSGSMWLLWNDSMNGDVLAKDYMRRLLTGEADGNGNLPSR